MMERRKHERKDVSENTKVFIYHHSKKLTFGIVKDIAVGGVYLKRIRNLSIPNGSIVKLVFAIELDDTVVNMHRKSGIIVRTESNTDAAISFFNRR